ncbi:MAG: DUF6502 family protein [Marinobacter sp.]|uniref:DUF6502 family protein n=1 Tax=Marinobacter sp. TaxID=50741 RepID=UPI00349FD57C
MNESDTKPLHRALARILRPLARLLLRNGVSFGEFSELVKQAYVEAAFEDFRDSRRKPTDSRAAVLTGLTRKEIKRLRELTRNESVQRVSRLHINRASRVVSGWVRDKHFQDAEGEPAMLGFDGPNSFSELVKRYSGDMTPRAVLDELVRVGVVEHTDKLILRKKAYIPTGDDQETLHIFGEDVGDLISTVDHNLTTTQPVRPPMYQRTLTYDNIPPEIIYKWRAHAAQKSQELLETLDRWLAPYDRDISQRIPGNIASPVDNGSVRTGVSVFYFEDPIQTDRDGENES